MCVLSVIVRDRTQGHLRRTKQETIDRDIGGRERRFHYQDDVLNAIPAIVLPVNEGGKWRGNAVLAFNPVSVQVICRLEEFQELFVNGFIQGLPSCRVDDFAESL